MTPLASPGYAYVTNKEFAVESDPEKGKSGGEKKR